MRLPTDSVPMQLSTIKRALGRKEMPQDVVDVARDNPHPCPRMSCEVPSISFAFDQNLFLISLRTKTTADHFLLDCEGDSAFLAEMDPPGNIPVKYP